MNESLCIGFIYPDVVHGLFMQSVTGYLLEDARRGKDARIGHGRGGTIGLMSGPRIASARNQLVDTFLHRTKAEWLLMVDTDMVFDPEDVDQLFAAADPETCPIVGGLCFTGGFGGAVAPTMYLLADPEENDGEPIRRVMDYPEGLCRVDATGAAFLLMHRGVLERIGRENAGTFPWFAESVYKTAAFGEDWTFCMRAKVLDIPVYVNTLAKIGHVKSAVLDERAFQDYRAREARIGVEGITEGLSALGLEKV